MNRREVVQLLAGAPFAAGLLHGCARDAREVAREIEAIPGVLRGASAERGHALRGATPVETFDGARSESVDVAIVGGGIAGLAALRELARHDVRDVRVFELEPRVGGSSAASDQGGVAPHPLGAHYLPVPLADNEDLVTFLRELELIEGVDEHGDPIGREERLVRDPAERLFHLGFWYAGLYPRAGASPTDLAELDRFERLVARYVGLRDGAGRRAFTLPVAHASTEADVLALDRVPASELLAREGLRSPRLRFLLEYACKDDFGLGLDDASAWSLLFYHAARVKTPGGPSRPFLAWPDGNAALARGLLGDRGERVQLGTLVVDVRDAGDGVVIHALDADGRPFVVRARRAIVAAPRFVTRRIVASLRGTPADEPFEYGAWLVVNLHLRSRPVETGFPLAWDNVLFDGPSLGYVVATHQLGDDYGASIFTYYLPMTDTDPRRGREKLDAATYEGVRELVLRDLSRAHPDLPRRVAHIDAYVHGHGMVRPKCGVMSSAARLRAAEPVGHVHFAGSDLSGVALFEEAFFHGTRAAREVAAALRPLPSAASVSERGGAASETQP